MSNVSFRSRMVARLTEDLVGPMSAMEVLSDRPTQRYSTGILYPQDSRIEAEEDEDGGLATNEVEDGASSASGGGVSLYATSKPSTAGLSFAVEPVDLGLAPTAEIRIRCATYVRVAVDDEGNAIEGPPADRQHARWRRSPIDEIKMVELVPGESKLALFSPLAAGLELYVLVTPKADLLTVTAALANRRGRGDSRDYDEEQHFFQVELAILRIGDGDFAPRPSRRAATDEDARTASLIYREVKEYVVGHTCSASAVQAPSGADFYLKTEWVPAVEVPVVSDRGDHVFEDLRTDPKTRVLEAGWLAHASRDSLVDALRRVTGSYRQWITAEEGRIPSLPEDLRPQAERHIERCLEGAGRMEAGITAVQDDELVRTSFQLAQDAMAIQFEWSRNGETLIWRPFQLAFQLLVLQSLASRDHPDRLIMDLLWFPTGGGKTEAYLALAAFTIFLRRQRCVSMDGGGGVAVLMRYTLRLLTVQQFQRAAAMICACELLRRRAAKAGQAGFPLGTPPIGIGLWVGAGATPSTLRDARDQTPGDYSTPKQLTGCPCCGAPLVWTFAEPESTVKCTAETDKCELAATGPSIPVWTIDDEIYRATPSLLIGTVDKFAQIVRKPETGALFGKGRAGGPPEFIIQDELHLISGPLGSIAGLYEVAIDELCRHDGVPPKIVGSTATIRRATEQARALFDRGTYQFPPPGLDAGNSGFAVVDKSRPGRLYLGVTTAGRSATYMLQAIAASLLESATQPSVPEHERDFYWTLVIYFNSLRELGRALVLMQDDVPVSIGQLAARRGEVPREISVPAELTSRRRAYEIRDMLDELKRKSGDPEAVDLLLASNMISVGMDIPRLGVMLVNAQPKTLSEYIQATSRVGRGDVPGIIVTMYNSTRARDRSRYETFQTWHNSLYRDVEATSVTPFASRAQDKALHAVLVALVRHLIPSMERVPILPETKRADVERLAGAIEQRVASVDPSELARVSQKLKLLIDEWASRQDLQAYWDDYNRRVSLLMSAEQFAAKASLATADDAEGERRALWPTPNSMREVEAGTPFVLRRALKGGGE